MRIVEIIHAPSAEQRATVAEFVQRATPPGGERPLSDHLWLHLTGSHDGPLLVTIAEQHTLIACAQMSPTGQSTTLEVVVDPTLDDGETVGLDAATTAIDAFGLRGGGPITWWLDDPTDTATAVAQRYGLAPTRTLYEMRCQLPLTSHADIATRAFRPGADDEAFLRVNNRAFAGHGEQAGWSLDDLHERIAAPWFDADGFRVFEQDGQMIGFCWTKIHHDHQPVLGEIYVIAVDPAHHGHGYGRQLTLAGLDAITARGIRNANLYVDAHNTAAVHVYTQLGFVVHHSRHTLTGQIARTLPEEAT